MVKVLTTVITNETNIVPKVNDGQGICNFR